MFVRSKAEAERRDRPGVVSYFLLERGDAGQDALAVTWVYVAPGSKQPMHQHPEQQAYIIIEGRGVMQVGEKEQPVRAGELVYIPSNVPHGLKNTGDQPLAYISAASPAFDLRYVYDEGHLTPDAYEE